MTGSEQRTTRDWWPNQLDLTVLHRHDPRSDPRGANFDYAAAFAELDVEELRRDLVEVVRTPQDPEDGHCAPLFVRASRRAAGTYRIHDGRGGGQVQPDDAGLDQARRLLWPVKQKHGRKISWADLLAFAGNVAVEDMGLPTAGFGFGREDVWVPEEVSRRPEDVRLGDAPDPPASAHDIRVASGRMALDDEETVALVVVGGRTVGTCDDRPLRTDPVYGPIAARFQENPDQLADAFAKAWYKLLHRGLGPVSRHLGPWVPEPQPWQDPVPPRDHELVDDADVVALKERVLASGLSVSQLVSTAWASAATFRATDKRGGANGARIRLAPQKDWEANRPEQLAPVLQALERIRQDFNAAQTGGHRVSLADLIVLAGSAAVEKAAADAGYAVTVPFAPGRTDATQEQTDVASIAVLEPRADGFRNYLQDGVEQPPETLLVERACLLGLSAPEMTVLVGGLRVLRSDFGTAEHGVLTDRPGVLTTDFFRNLLDMGTEWSASETEHVYEGRDRATGEVRYPATAVDLVFGSNSVLRALAEVHASDDAEERFVRDFVAAWVAVMNADRFDLA